MTQTNRLPILMRSILTAVLTVGLAVYVHMPAWSAETQSGHEHHMAESSGSGVLPDLPWAKAAREHLPPGLPGQDYRPIVVPNGVALPWKIVDGVKIYHLTAEPIVWEIAPGLRVTTWGYNGRTPGPVIEAVEGDRVRIYVTNKLPQALHAVHWHAMLLPSGMDGVSGLNQKAIQPGETYRYEFYVPHAGTFMYHSHHDSMTQDGLGLVGMFVVHPRGLDKAVDRDFGIMLHEWKVSVGTSRPDPNEMTDFNVLTMNGKAFPATAPLVAKLGDRVRIRFGNLSAMDHHPIHLHGYSFRVTGTDGGPIPTTAQWPETTVLVPVGATRDVEFLADNPGDWIMHCHMTHHMMNQMGHGLPNMIGVDMRGVEDQIRKLVPGFMTMGTSGMDHMMHMPIPPNSIPMKGGNGPYGIIDMGGMTTILKVREGLTSYDDPGWYHPPEGTLVRPATAEELKRDGIEAPAPAEAPPTPVMHDHGPMHGDMAPAPAAPIPETHAPMGAGGHGH